jgi:lysophospholipase L1-like esterase
LFAAWVCTLLVPASVILARGARATFDSYFDGYYVALAWIIAAAILPASRALPGSPLQRRWRLLVMAWAVAGGLAWLGAAYLHNRPSAFFSGLLIALALLALCHFWFRLSAWAIVTVNTLILLLLGLPVADVLVRSVASLQAPPDARRQYYLYDVAKRNPPAFGRWWNYYVAQWRQAEKRLRAPDADPVLTYHLRPNDRVRFAKSTIPINSRGFRGREVSLEKGDAYRIVALGESTTFGLTLAPDHRPWPELLEQMIRERLKLRRPVEVINAGVPGYRLDQNLRRFATDILPLRPDVVISYHGINGFCLLGDAVPPRSGASPPIYKERPLRLLADFEYRLKMMRFQHRRSPRRTMRPRPLADPLATASAQRYRELIQLAHTNHMRLVLADFSMAVNEHSDRALVEFYQAGYASTPWAIQANLVHSTLVRNVAGQHPEVTFVDTQPRLDGEHDNFIDLVHFAPSGDLQLAETFFAALKPILEKDLSPL